jgi:beta-phosphoglucomutase-like phosphatase (HAD superfamily)
VLANSEPLHFRAFRDVLAENGVALSEADYYGRYLGFDDVGSFAAIARDRGLAWDPAFTAELTRKKAIVMEALERDVAVFFPGAAALVRDAAAAFPIAIASGALGPEIRRVLERERLTGCFTAIVSAEDTPSSKPAPDPYARAVLLLSGSASTPIRPHECVAIEDSGPGLESARGAGLHTVAVAHTYPANTLAADLVVESIDRLTIDALTRIVTR